ncbi:MAG: nucleotide exchange factor GrpE, partial [Lentisphaerota bacterium]
EVVNLKDQLLRLQADFDNYRKRILRDQADTALRAQENLMRELLPVLDHFELGLKTARDNSLPEAVLNGFQLVHDQLLAALSKFGLSTLHAEGAVFDPNLHEAITHMPSPDKPVDAVLMQTRRGYKLGDRLLRAAQVVVSSGKPAKDATPPADNNNQKETL